MNNLHRSCLPITAPRGTLSTEPGQVHLMAGAGEAAGLYAHLMGGGTKAEALRQAQLTLLRSDFYRHPYCWAPFVLYRDWR
ncbi:MAG TPA: CHAT domain-containing protein [Candidatus Acetothermia bacterium]|nr:CHAT domain-containing protein [Candidatus Acetothermia bacterium]